MLGFRIKTKYKIQEEQLLESRLNEGKLKAENKRLEEKIKLLENIHNDSRKQFVELTKQIADLKKEVTKYKSQATKAKNELAKLKGTK